MTDEVAGKVQGASEFMQHTAATLPEGVTAFEVTHYRVGPYTYSNLDDALAQHRQNLTKKVD